MPGEISLAHNGVLFLDEAAEFRTSVLQMLRVPLESGQITICRAGRSTTYPARFQLLLAMNPCPCGNYGSEDKICLCSARSVKQYWMKFSGPLLDRIEIKVDCNKPHPIGLDGSQLTLSNMRERVRLAWERQLARQGKLNHHLAPEEIAEYISPQISDGNREWLADRNLSPRAMSNVLKLAATIADIDGAGIDSGILETAVSLCGHTPLDTLEGNE